MSFVFPLLHLLFRHYAIIIHALKKENKRFFRFVNTLVVFELDVNFEKIVTLEVAG